MSTTEAIIARVVDQMATIPNIGQVHDRVRLLHRKVDFGELLMVNLGGTKRLRAWLVSLGRMATKQADAASRMDWDRVIRIEGRLDFEDAAGSETTSIALAEQVIRTLWLDTQNTKLGGTIFLGKPGQVVSTAPVSFASVICSGVTVEVPVHTIEDFQ